MRVVITGGTGFLGSHLVRSLIDVAGEVVVLKRRTSNLKRLEGVLDRVTLRDTDSDDLEALFRGDGGVDVVIHCATSYGRKGERPSDLISSNLLYPTRLLEIACRFGVKLFVNTHTALPGSVNQYALSKHQFRDWGRAVTEGAKTRFVNLRLESFYGPGQDEDHFVSYIVRDCARNRSELPLTPGLQERDFIFVDDVVSAYRLVVERATRGEELAADYDVGTGRPVRLRDLVEMVRRLSGSRTRLMFGVLPYRYNELMKSESDIAPLVALGWSPEVSLEEGLKIMIREATRP
jgi:nucleoside-diphosphate-sugar epimerase